MRCWWCVDPLPIAFVAAVLGVNCCDLAMGSGLMLGDVWLKLTYELFEFTRRTPGSCRSSSRSRSDGVKIRSASR